jgi:hypothetical protein
MVSLAQQQQQNAKLVSQNSILEEILGINQENFASVDVSSDKGLAAARRSWLASLQNP